MQGVVQEIVLTMAEAPVDSHEMTSRIVADLDTVYGIVHPDALAELVPAIKATYQAVNGTSHDAHQVDPTFEQQLRHTLSLDGRPPVGRADVVWDIGHEWKPPPPRAHEPTSERTTASRVST